MSTDTGPGGAGRPEHLPLAADRPVVDGTTRSAAELRAELAQLLAEDERRAAELRAAQQQAAALAAAVRADETRDNGVARGSAGLVTPPTEVVYPLGTPRMVSWSDRISTPAVLAGLAGVGVALVLLVRRRQAE